jgi:hypothetical protein
MSFYSIPLFCTKGVVMTHPVNPHPIPVGDQSFVCTSVATGLFNRLNVELTGPIGKIYIKADSGVINGVTFKQGSTYRIKIDEIQTVYQGDSTDAAA